MSRHFKIDDALAPEHREAFAALAREPGVTIDRLWEWLGEMGYRMARSSVGTWKKNFDEVLNSARRSSEMASSFMAVARQGQAADVSAAALARFQQLLMDKLFELDSEAGLESSELMKLSIALKTAVGAQQGIEELRADYDRKQREAAQQAEQVAKAGGSADAVVAKVREILGI